MSPRRNSPLRPPRALLAAAWAAFALAGTGRADEDPPPGAPAFTLGEIEVILPRATGVRGAERVTVIGAEQLQASGATTLDEALTRLPGVNVRVGGEGVPRIDVRGFRTRHVLLLLDGVPVGSAVDGQFDPALFPTENVAAIQVVEGPASVLYGPGGLGGVVNIVTRRAGGELRGSATAETGDRAPYLLRASATGGVGPLDLLVGGSASRVDAFPLSRAFPATSAQPGGYRSNSDRRREALLGSVSSSPVPDLDLGLTVHYAHTAYGKPSSVLGDDADPYAAAPKYDRVPGSSLLSLQLAGDGRPLSWLRVRGWAYANTLDEEDRRYDDGRYDGFDRRAGSYRQRVRSSTLGVALRPTLELGRAGTLGLLFSAERDRWRNGGTLTIGPDVYAPADFARTTALSSAALEYQVSPLPGLWVAAGYGAHLQSRAGGRATREHSALLATTYDVSAAVRLAASCARNVRFPSLGDLYAPGQGDPALGAERAVTCSAGADLRLPGRVLLAASAFATRARGLIQTDQATGLSTNLAEVRFTGLELSASARPAPPVSLHAGYALLRSQDRSRPGREELQYTPRHKASADAAWESPFGLSPFASVAYVGGQYHYPRNGFAGAKRKLADHLLVDARLRQQLAAGRVALYLGATNLLDQDYESSYGFPQRGRYVYAGAELRL